ncbi:MAG TPA: WecB/TagA/CpsF family glycosyltransferase [Alphaproteobacteria bacterium]|nr:WecB/TagA/CpsF family glycosyltransferase [Alphaproteobacteria bacterium]
MTAEHRDAASLDAASLDDAMAALLRRLTLLDDPAAVDALLDRLVRPEAPEVLAFVNAHAFNLAWRDDTFRADLMAADRLLRDGVGMAANLLLLRGAAGLNLNGTDLIPQILDRHRGRPVALCGTAPPWTEGAAEAVARRGCPVVLALDGFGGLEATADRLAAAPAPLILLGLGMPRQERLAALLRARLDRPALIVCGGAILDFLAGRFPRAPQALRRSGLEWAFRLALEPGRLAERYLAGGAAFAWRTARLRAQGRVAP